MPVHVGRKGHGAAAHGANYAPQQHPAPAAAAPRPAARKLSPDAAATRIQAEWRKARLARHRPALKQLATAAGQLRQLTEQLHEVQRQQPGVPLTQKQYLELSETVMKVLFALDGTSCGAATELRAKRKELTQQANALLDRIQAAHKAAPAAAAGAPSAPAAASVGGSSTAAAPALQAQQQQQPKQKKHWFRR